MFVPTFKRVLSKYGKLPAFERRYLLDKENRRKFKELSLRRFLLYHKLRTANNMILEGEIQLAEIAAPTPHAYDQVGILLGVRLRIQ